MRSLTTPLLLIVVLAGAIALPLPLRAASPTTPSQAAEAVLPMPVWNRSSGQIEAVLWIDTSTLPPAPGRRDFGRRWTAPTGTDGLRFGLFAHAEPRFGLLCGRPGAALDRLGEGCLVTQMAGPQGPASSSLTAQASTRIGRSEWTGFAATQRGSTEWLQPGSTLASLLPELLPLAGLPGAAEQNDLGIIGELRIGEQGWIHVGGSIARARLLPVGQPLAVDAPDRWDSRSLSIGGGIGAIGGEVIGRVVEVPGREESFGSLGLGLTWRTPWSGRLTVGAQNLLSTGEHPLQPIGNDRTPIRSEGRVPYVRFQQDL